MAFIGPMQMAGHLLPDETPQSELSDQKVVHRSLTGSETFIQLPGDNIANTDFTIDVPSDAPITDMQMSLTPLWRKTITDLSGKAIMIGQIQTRPTMEQ